jgi:hypothetical protein
LSVFICFGVYLVLAFWFNKQITTTELLSNNSVILDVSLNRHLVIAGIMGATVSSALSTLVGAPRTLAALADNRTIPFYMKLRKLNKNGAPQFAILISCLVSLLAILAGNLNSLAELLTLFFLTTYGTINLIVFIEKFIGVVSFRPRMDISIIIPVVGLIGCFLAMLLINYVFTIVALLSIIIIYTALAKKNLISPWGDMRGGIFIAAAELAAQVSMKMPYHAKIWKPSIIVPVERPEDFKRVSRFIREVIYPSGRVYLLSVNNKENNYSDNDIDNLLKPLKEDNLFAHKVIVSNADFKSCVHVVFQSMLSSFLPTNAALFILSNKKDKQLEFNELLKTLNNHHKHLL